ncbi:hypothetical protein H696_03183 [Fonticula alba]|uniref:DH domain-containing protein n=1 Tax=Fonticula alba TaxID=691883 RepID=A0A058Z9N2_FONAL|nr:hypothetical protein H696_03183 [Fonticula alba]KCV70826.1 hypothetical protein H696_03183 [Fonticula alba]|eukprot:XP_009495342.1 hypothetical protein H696_03183 [Fonticula alba]
MSLSSPLVASDALDLDPSTSTLDATLPAEGLPPTSPQSPVSPETAPRAPSKEPLHYVIEEIITSEAEYIKSLEVVVMGYKHTIVSSNMFKDNETLISKIFGNAEDLLVFHREFYATLREISITDVLALAQAFLKHRDGFKMYAQYCTNHPVAVDILKSLQGDERQRVFMACQMMINQAIPLEGFLLTPIQRLCKYPLLLREVIKATPEIFLTAAPVSPSSPGDSTGVAGSAAATSELPLILQAEDLMKKSASFVNEMQRLHEAKIHMRHLQTRIDDFAGPDLDVDNKELLYDSPVVKVSNSKSQARHLFLFDNCLLYCRDHPLKKNYYQFKGRVALQKLLISDVEGPVASNRGPMANVFEMTRYDTSPPKKYYICLRSQQEKRKWLSLIQARQDALPPAVSPVDVTRLHVDTASLSPGGHPSASPQPSPTPGAGRFLSVEVSGLSGTESGSRPSSPSGGFHASPGGGIASGTSSDTLASGPAVTSIAGPPLSKEKRPSKRTAAITALFPGRRKSGVPDVAQQLLPVAAGAPGAGAGGSLKNSRSESSLSTLASGNGTNGAIPGHDMYHHPGNDDYSFARLHSPGDPANGVPPSEPRDLELNRRLVDRIDLALKQLLYEEELAASGGSSSSSPGGLVASGGTLADSHAKSFSVPILVVSDEMDSQPAPRTPANKAPAAASPSPVIVVTPSPPNDGVDGAESAAAAASDPDPSTPAAATAAAAAADATPSTPTSPMAKTSAPAPAMLAEPLRSPARRASISGPSSGTGLFPGSSTGSSSALVADSKTDRSVEGEARAPPVEPNKAALSSASSSSTPALEAAVARQVRDSGGTIPPGSRSESAPTGAPPAQGPTRRSRRIPDDGPLPSFAERQKLFSGGGPAPSPLGGTALPTRSASVRPTASNSGLRPSPGGVPLIKAHSASIGHLSESTLTGLRSTSIEALGPASGSSSTGAGGRASRRDERADWLVEARGQLRKHPAAVSASSGSLSSSTSSSLGGR